MKHLTGTVAAVVAAIAGVATVALAQQQPLAPRVAFVYPAGGQQGTTVRVVVGGRSIVTAVGAMASGAGLESAVVDRDRPLNQREINDLREKAEALQKETTPEARAELREIRQRIGDSIQRNRNPTIAEYVTLEVTIAADAEPGPRHLRLQTPQGLTNPLIFIVGQLPEFDEPVVRPSPSGAPQRPGQPAALQRPAVLPPVVTLPVTVNGRLVPGEGAPPRPLAQAGQYQPGDVDRYRFQATAGQDLVAVVSARNLMPYLADAVPGWFQATLALYDAGGREVAYCDDFRLQPDPVLHYRVPADGEFTLEVRDAIYRGREDFVYRVSIGELPYVTGIYPLGGPAGASPTVAVTGWNLPIDRLAVDTKRAVPGVYPVSVRAGRVESNRVAFAVNTLPEVLEVEMGPAAERRQSVTLPIIVNGRVDRPGDWDEFTFPAKAGDTIVADVQARRLGSPLDSVLELTGPAGTRVAFSDDVEDKGAGLVTHHADSSLTAVLPAAGTYRVRISERQQKGGSEYAYRLRISRPQPDFDLMVAPSSLNVPAGTSVPLTVVAVRRDGFAGDIALSLADAPPGYSLSGAMLPAGQDRVRLTLSAPPRLPAPQAGSVPIGIRGTAAIEGRTITRRAKPTEEMMQAFAYTHLVPADSLRVFTTGRGGARMPIRVLSGMPVSLGPGRSSRVRVTLPPGYRNFENIRVELSDPPEGIGIGDVDLRPDGAEFTIHADPAKAKAGLRGNLIVVVSGERVPQANRPANPNRQRIPLGTLPAIPFEIVK
ncbi:MAG: hypothetical protein AB1806_02015 [Acidobacteriota bacterium]